MINMRYEIYGCGYDLKTNSQPSGIKKARFYAGLRALVTSYEGYDIFSHYIEKNIF